MDPEESWYEEPTVGIGRREKPVYVNSPDPNITSQQTTVKSNTKPTQKKVQSIPRSHFSNQHSKFLVVGWIILAILLTVILIFVITIKMDVTDDECSSSSAMVSSNSEMAESCQDLRKQGVANDGIYEIQTNKDFFNFRTFCDMTTDGGGWTLVASVHENDIKSKCDSQDLWSVYSTREKPIGKSAWENEITFGDVNESSIADYKNRGYFQMNASDVMIWHVPNGVPLDDFKKNKGPRYRTTNSFLQKFGGNLQNLFAAYPVSPVPEYEYDKVLKNRTKRSLEALTRRAPAIIKRTTQWYQYRYDYIYGTSISGNSMYGSFGNQISFNCGTNTGFLQYGQYTQCDKSYIIASAKTHPFYAVVAIMNEKRKTSRFTLQVKMLRPTSANNYTHTTNAITNGNFQLQYQLVQFSTTGYNTVSEFYFIVTNLQDWNSVEPTSFTRDGSTSFGSTYKYSNIHANGHPSNFIMGYVLLASANGSIVDADQANNVAKEILDEYSTLPNLFSDFQEENRSIAIPIHFDRGSTFDVMEMVPSNFTSKVHPGFLQFRVFNDYGYPNALCPGIKTKHNFPEYLCIGGISDDIDHLGTCGDLTGWEGERITGTNTSVPGTFHSQDDISTSFLIFYR